MDELEFTLSGPELNNVPVEKEDALKLNQEKQKLLEERQKQEKDRLE